jgi:spore coat polysaccharide biosynthesis predicted glycosyltransferase SpsG
VSIARALCRLDAGPSAGLGHLQRCLALAEALRAQGTDVVFLAPAFEDVRSRIAAAGCRLEPFELARREAGGTRDLALTEECARRHGCTIVIVDSYDMANHYLGSLRAAGLFVVALDDLAQHAFAAHVVVNGGAAATELSYRSLGDTTFLLGPEYTLLRRAFWDVPPRHIAPMVRNVLVTVGGGDPRGVLPLIVAGVDAADEPYTITVVCGPFLEGHQPLVAAGRRHDVTWLPAPPHLRDVMASADLAVSAGGQSLCELAATGTPTIAFEAFSNQAANVRGLAVAGVVINVGSVQDEGFSRRLSQAVVTLVRGYAERAQMSHAGRTLIDGRGAARVAETIYQYARPADRRV